MRKFYLVAALVMLSACASLSQNETVSVVKNQPEFIAKRAVGNLFSAMKRGSSQWEDLIAEGMLPSKLSFVNETEQRLLDNRILKIDYSIEQVLESTTDKQAVTVKWHKTYQTSTGGGTQLAEGEATFIFTLENQQWVLFRIDGNNPF